MTARERRLDVSRLEPCEPLEQTLEAASALQAGEYLRVLHSREPFPLFPLLEQMGCGWHCRPGRDAPYEVLVWRRDDPLGKQAVARLVEAP
jgi:hypothetical protein